MKFIELGVPGPADAYDCDFPYIEEHEDLLIDASRH